MKRFPRPFGLGAFYRKLTRKILISNKTEHRTFSLQTWEVVTAFDLIAYGFSSLVSGEISQFESLRALYGNFCLKK